jgi:hypothetical protein
MGGGDFFLPIRSRGSPRKNKGGWWWCGGGVVVVLNVVVVLGGGVVVVVVVVVAVVAVGTVVAAPLVVAVVVVVVWWWCGVVLVVGGGGVGVVVVAVVLECTLNVTKMYPRVRFFIIFMRMYPWVHLGYIQCTFAATLEYMLHSHVFLCLNILKQLCLMICA